MCPHKPEGKCGHTIYCKSFEVEKFCGFRRSMGTVKFSSEIACAVFLDMQDYHLTVNVFQRLKFSSATATSNDLQYTVLIK